MNAPSLVLAGVVLVFPLCYAAYLSFSKVRIGELRRGFPFPFYGLENYVRLFEDELFLLSLQNTFVFAVIVVVVEVMLGLSIALLINQQGIWLSRVSRMLVDHRGHRQGQACDLRRVIGPFTENIRLRRPRADP